ncbi:MAG: hypothetical protein IPJ78_08985 [Gemmatimonadetes bacterium]|nr:hypothetical protein [Gemmatimonadota bacterium]
MRKLAALLAVTLILAACNDVSSTSPDLSSASSSALAKGASGGGGGTTTPVPQILPTTAPAPGVLLRESFGQADLLRPHGGKGTLRETYIHTTIGGFWLEWPGSKNAQWMTPNGDQTWKIAACTDDPYETLPAPLQLTYGNGCISSEWFDAVTEYPAALQPFRAPSTAYEVSIDTWVAPIPGAYIGLGFTNSSILLSNLATSAPIWIRMTDPLDGGDLQYELRTNGMSGPVLATGRGGVSGWDPIALRYDPVAQTVTLRVNGETIGTYPFTMAPPRYVGFEGVGVLDNFVVRQ